jgi:predicted ribosome quality control (RQC) complex YloA/Tae2 family protein
VHNNYYFLKQLSAELEKNLNGFSIVSCFSQNKEELVIEFNNTKKSFFIKASLPAHFSCLSFPEVFNRARKNSIDLFNKVLLKKVTGIQQFENERSFSILLESNLQLIFKMHGNRSNIILAENGIVDELFKNQLIGDLEIDISKLHRKIDWSKEAFFINQNNLSALYFTFGKEVWEYLGEQQFDRSSLDEKWLLIQSVIAKLNQPAFFIIDKDNKLVFSLLPIGKVSEQFTDPVKAVTIFFNRFTSESAFYLEKNSILKKLHEKLTAAKNYIAKNQQKLVELQNDHHYQQWADLVMANLHRIKTGDEKLEAENFYNENKPVEIKLKKEYTGQKNAEVFYRKGKNQQIEIQKLKEAIATKEKEIAGLLTTISETAAVDELRSLRKKTESSPILKEGKESFKSLPYHEFEFKGYKIWVGKNAESNDKLTLKYSFKEDLWLHVKDVPGSHVIIKHQAGKNFPKDVIERAAELAAYNSKRKTESLCAVLFTPKKYVRKRKGDPAGAMVVEREEVILVEPKLEARS